MLVVLALLSINMLCPSDAEAYTKVIRVMTGHGVTKGMDNEQWHTNQYDVAGVQFATAADGAGEAVIYIPLKDEIPNGATLNAFWVGGNDSSNSAITTQLYRSYLWFESPILLASVASNNSSSFWASSTLNHTYSISYAYWFAITIPQTASGEMVVWSIVLDYTP